MKVRRVREIHNISVLHVDGRTEVSLHLKLPGDSSLEEAHRIASEVERAIEEALPGVDAVRTHLEPLAEEAEGRGVGRGRRRRGGGDARRPGGDRRAAARAPVPRDRRRAASSSSRSGSTRRCRSPRRMRARARSRSGSAATCPASRRSSSTPSRDRPRPSQPHVRRVRPPRPRASRRGARPTRRGARGLAAAARRARARPRRRRDPDGEPVLGRADAVPGRRRAGGGGTGTARGTPSASASSSAATAGSSIATSSSSVRDCRPDDEALVFQVLVPARALVGRHRLHLKHDESLPVGGAAARGRSDDPGDAARRAGAGVVGRSARRRTGGPTRASRTRRSSTALRADAANSGDCRPMKLCMFSPKELDLERGWPGRIEGDRVIQLAAQTLQSFFTGGGEAREHAEYPLADVVLRAPVLRPPAVRDFYAFEQHVKTARGAARPGGRARVVRAAGLLLLEPVRDLRARRRRSRTRRGREELDYELEVAAIIGADGQIGGFTVMNDWSARDLQRLEMKVGLGPAKGKDFATSLGPVVVTPDEFDGTSAVMTARVNGEERSRGAARRHALLVGADRRAGRAEHAALPGRRARLGDGRDGLHPRARRRPVAAARRRGRARGRGDRRAAEHVVG